ncbi:TetR family transcriptional regulator [Williamsia limnetica]|uniref:TetR family transcriptional regulator n=1 Tax=Williamsia limnetica TaxID=882452 RepID=A0A318R955_WILLI|nr:TetR/AcrR family transcriptional regulator [Williamsia limnetica]PYE12137.1 TetR family transcriptional regulator [Williamsia limnetica]
MATKWGDRDARRRDILTAGAELLADKGYAALQMRDVAKGAGISLGTIYTYFATKEALFAELYAERLTLLHKAIEPACVATEDPVDLFVLVATEYLDVYRTYGRELNIWSLLADTNGETTSVHTEALTSAAHDVLALLHNSLERMFRERSDAGSPQMTNALTVLWATMTGLADQFTGVRHRLHRTDWDGAAHFAATTLTRGLGLRT